MCKHEMTWEKVSEAGKVFGGAYNGRKEGHKQRSRRGELTRLSAL